jgi:bifunctional DNA-binding transcriptional regulator/antitoxin component of YhaV-PrlF toxin-antitoxin module
MTATLTPDGNIEIPVELRAQAELKPGDILQVQLYDGTTLLRKHRPLTPAQCAALLGQNRSQPSPTAEDEAVVEKAVRQVRSRGG